MKTGLAKIAVLALSIMALAGCGGSGGGGTQPPAGGGGDASSTGIDATLSALSLSGVSLNAVFQSSQYSYTASVGYATTATSVTATTSDTNATLTVNGTTVSSGSASGSVALAVGSNTITIVVTAEDGTTTQTYSIAVTRYDTRLSSLELSATTLDQVFQSDQLSYTASVTFLQLTTSITAATNDSNATLTINGVTVSSGSASNAIDLAEGSNTVTVVVTAPDGVNSQSYTIDVTRSLSSSFAQQAYLKASNAETDDQLGWSVAIEGDTMAVGAPYEDSTASGGESDNSGTNAGAVYVFTRDSGNIWSQQAILKADNNNGSAYFGNSVAISGDSIVVGAYGESGGIGNSGAAYVFTRSGTTWSQQAYLKASNAGNADQFGVSVDIDADTVVAGAWFEDSSVGGGGSDNSTSNAGAAYVFTRSGTTWSQQALLKASNAEVDDHFGWSVAVDGDTVVVGAYDEDSSATGGEADNTALGAGAVYVFVRSGTTWSQQAYLKAGNASTDDRVGWCVAIDGDTLATGAMSQNYAGAAYVFVRSGTSWSQQAFLKSDNIGTSDGFGQSIAISGDTLAVGAPTEDSSASGGGSDNSASNAGAAYVFTRSGTSWSQQAYLKASNAEAGDLLGYSVAIDNGSVAAAGYREDSSANGGESDNTATDAGAAYVWQ